jgi:hypothetical protein
VGQATQSLPSLAPEASPKGESGKTAKQKVLKKQDNNYYFEVFSYTE